MKKWGIALILFILSIMIIVLGMNNDWIYSTLIVAIILSFVFSIYSIIKKEGDIGIPILLLVFNAALGVWISYRLMLSY